MLMSSRLRTAALILVALGCSSIPSVDKPPFRLRVRVTSDPGIPVHQATLHLGKRQLSATDLDGTTQLELTGSAGQFVELRVVCPKGLISPVAPIEVALRRLSDQQRLPEYDVRCPPERRHVVVAVRAKQGAGLPVMYLGREIGRTDASGAAHVSLELKPNTRFRLRLDTSNRERLLPRSPAAVFQVPDRDELLIFDQAFTLKAKKNVVKRRRKRLLPIRI